MTNEIIDGERDEKLERVDFETAIHHAGYGKFQVWLLCVCGAIYATCAISTTTLSFVLPSAECDFSLSSESKGKLNATPLIGMCVGSYLWGNLADARGRKWAIIGALLLDAAAAFLSSLAQTFPLFLACRFFSGFGIIGATGLIFPYFGDFLSLRHRDVMLCRLEVFWTLGTILLPAIAWAVIPQKWDIEAVDEVFSYNSWRVFVALCGVPSLLAAAFLAPFPESPRYLLAAGRSENALTVLRSIFAMNKSQPRDHYPVQSMILGDEEEQTPPAEDANANETKGAPGGVEAAVSRGAVASPVAGWRASASLRWQKFWQRKKTLVGTPYITMLALCCFVDFGLMFSYYTLMMWFPDLFERFGQFAALHPDESAGVCQVSSIVTELSDSAMNVTTKCDRPIDARVFLYTLIVGMSCLPTSISVGLTINKLGKKLMLVLMLISSGLAALGLNFVHSSFQNLVLSCVFEAIISCTEAVLFCVICELFPTNVGATAMSVTVTFGRVGAIVGNVVFGALIDLDCYIPIYIFGFLLISSGLLCIVLPKHPQPALN